MLIPEGEKKQLSGCFTVWSGDGATFGGSFRPNGFYLDPGPSKSDPSARVPRPGGFARAGLFDWAPVWLKK